MTAAGAIRPGVWPVPPAMVTAAVCAGVLDACIVLLRGYSFQGGTVPVPDKFVAWLNVQGELLSDPQRDPFFRSTYVGSISDPLVGFLYSLGVLKDEVEYLRNGLLELESSPRVELATAIVKALEDAACFARGTARDLVVSNDTGIEGTIH